MSYSVTRPPDKHLNSRVCTSYPLYKSHIPGIILKISVLISFFVNLKKYVIWSFSKRTWKFTSILQNLLTTGGPHEKKRRDITNLKKFGCKSILNKN